MRLWSLHPKYLDPQGLVALWREALLAQAVIRGETRGYRSHPQLDRFRAQQSALDAIGAYLAAVHAEAGIRGYSFDGSKIERAVAHPPITVTSGQMEFEWQHLMSKLSVRNPALYEAWNSAGKPACHPLFRVCDGRIEAWERAQARS
jgi:pyrimidine dimer DNA glycosylase